MSLMKQHQRKCKDNEVAAPRNPVAQTQKRDMRGLGLTTELSRWTKQIDNDALLLREIKSIEQRAIEKKELIKKYLPYLEEYLAQDKRHDNPVLVRVMIWLFDTKQIDKALEYAEHCIIQGDKMPDGFNSTLPIFVLDTVFDFVEEQHKAKSSAEPYLSTMMDFMEGHDIYDQIRLKYLKLAGLIAHENEQWQTAHEYFVQCEKLSSKAGVKTKRIDCEKQLEKAANAKAKKDQAQATDTGPDVESEGQAENETGDPEAENPEEDKTDDSQE